MGCFIYSSILIFVCSSIKESPFSILTGLIQNHLKCGHNLSFVDISNHRLVRALPSSVRNVSENRVVKSNGNCLSWSAQHQHAVSYCTETRGKTKLYQVQNFVGVVVVILVIIVDLGLCIVVNYSRGI